MGTSRQRDGEWLDLVADLMERPLAAWPAETIIVALRETFDAPAGAFYGRAGAEIVQVNEPAYVDPDQRAAVARWTVEQAPSEHPLLRYYLGSGRSDVMQVAHVPTLFLSRGGLDRWREVCAGFLGPEDVSAQLSLPLWASAGANRSFIVGRAEDIALARRVGRVLAALDRQIVAHARWRGRLGPAAHGALDTARAVGLTPRETAVLELLAGGLTARAMARRLAIAERTVQKHLQRIYAKLGATDRLAAVQRAELIGLLPPRT